MATETTEMNFPTRRYLILFVSDGFSLFLYVCGVSDARTSHKLWLSGEQIYDCSQIHVKYSQAAP